LIVLLFLFIFLFDYKAICGKPKDMLEGSVQIMLPSDPLLEWKATVSPYRRTYSRKKHKAEWETNKDYCAEKVFQNTLYQSKILLDVIDMSIFDFFIGNLDRHHFERIISLGNKTFSLHLDHGRTFGKPYEDDRHDTIIYPLKQCCLIRYTTYLRLKYLYKNGFSKLLDESLRDDPLYPILTSSHLEAIDRRLEIVLNEINTCISNFKPYEVLVDDGY